MPDASFNEVIFYRSIFRHGVDEKRRVMVPAKWRSSHPDVEYTLILWPNGGQPDACLLVLPPARMLALAEKIASMSSADPQQVGGRHTRQRRAHSDSRRHGEENRDRQRGGFGGFGGSVRDLESRTLRLRQCGGCGVAARSLQTYLTYEPWTIARSRKKPDGDQGQIGPLPDASRGVAAEICLGQKSVWHDSGSGSQARAKEYPGSRGRSQVRTGRDGTAASPGFGGKFARL